MSATYTRGTKTHQVTSKALQAGDVVLTEDTDHANTVRIAGSKTGAILRTVASSEYVEPRRELGERNRRIRVTFTDGTQSATYGGATTWAAAEVPAEKAPAEEAPAEKLAKAAKPAGTCACCGQATKGGHYLPGHDARHVACLVAEIRTGRDAREALAEIPVKHQRLTAKLLERLAKLGMHPGA